MSGLSPKSRSPKDASWKSSAYAQRVSTQPPLAGQGSPGRKPGSSTKSDRNNPNGSPDVSPTRQMSQSMSAGYISSTSSSSPMRRHLSCSTSFSSPAARAFASGGNLRIACPESANNTVRLPPLVHQVSEGNSPKRKDWRNADTMPNLWAIKTDEYTLSPQDAAAKAEMRQFFDGATSPPVGAADKSQRAFSPNLEALYKSISAGPTPDSPFQSPKTPDRSPKSPGKGRLERSKFGSSPTLATSKVESPSLKPRAPQPMPSPLQMPLPVESPAVSPHVSRQTSPVPGPPSAVPGSAHSSPTMKPQLAPAEKEVPDADVRKPSLRSKATMAAFTNVVSSVVEQQKPPATAASSLWKKAAAEVQRVIKADSLFVIEGASRHKEACERLQMGLMSDSESRRVHEVFNRFAHGEEDIDRSVLDHVIQHLGYILADEDVINVMADKISNLSGFDIKEMFEFLDDFATAQDGVLRAIFNNRASVRKKSKAPAGGELLEDSPKTIAVDKVHLVMRDLQFYTTDNNMEELMVRAGFEDKLYFDYDDIAKVVAAYNVCEGFSDKELKEAQDVFQKAVKESVEGSLSTAELPNALLDFFGVHYIKDLRELREDVGEALEPLDVYGPQPNPVSFHEFLVWARRLRNANIAELSESFVRITSDDNGTMSFDELKDYIKQAGFSLTFVEMNEFLEACHLRSRQSFCFDEALQCLAMCRKSEGFSAQDLEDRIAVYNKFDEEDKGELTTMTVVDLMRHMGYQVTPLDVERYAHEVDFNGNGTMDMNEFLRLMRLHVEVEVETVFDVYHRWVRKGDRLPIGKLHEVLKESKCCPSHCDVYDELFPDVIDPSSVDFSFDEFKVIGDKCRTRVMKTMRKRANFSEDELEVFKGTFRGYDVAGKGILENKPLSMLLFHSGIPQHTTEHRAQALTMLDQARHTALQAEVPEKDVGPMGVFSVPWWVMVHAWRIITREHERMRLDRLDAAREATNFSMSEVIEFQEIFKIFRNRAGASAPVEQVNEGRRRSMPELKVITQKTLKEPAAVQEEPLTLEKILGLKNSSEQLPFASLKLLLGHLKLKLSAVNASALHAQFETITKTEESEDSEGTIDIAGFLHLMRWMLDTNFANINDKSAHVAKTVVPAPVPERIPSKKPPVEPLSPTSPKSTKFLRRASV